MKTLPSDVNAYKQTPVFTEQTIPNGILNQHQTKPGVWGKIVVLKGKLQYTILEPEHELIELSPDKFGVVEPTMLHHVTPLGSVEFYVEFYH
jgi:tellurite resistance-related uncharacterized protein